MRTIFISVVTAVIFMACKNNDQKQTEVKGGIPVINTNDPTQFTSIQWLDSLVDFGTVKEGETKDIQFRFKNTGNKPLVITSVAPSCGCTVPEFSREPIQPGKEGFVKAVFNSAGQHATVHKTITVSTNTQKQTDVIAFIGDVVN